MAKNHIDVQTTREAHASPRLHRVHDAEGGEAAMPGRVQHDTRGNAFWSWDIATGVLAGAKARELLLLLDDPTLQLAGEGDLATAWAGDPYNRA